MSETVKLGEGSNGSDLKSQRPGEPLHNTSQGIAGDSGEWLEDAISDSTASPAQTQGIGFTVGAEGTLPPIDHSTTLAKTTWEVYKTFHLHTMPTKHRPT